MEMLENLVYDETQYIGELDYELIGGEKFFMAAAAPRISHGIIVMRLGTIFTRYIDEKKITAFVVGDNVDLYLSNDYHFRPDLCVILNPKLIENDKYIDGVPDLVVEVLSQSTMKRDIGIKKNLYEKHGVKEYWIVDPWSKRIEVYHLINGKYELNEIYSACSTEELDKLKDEDRAAIKTDIKVSIFDDLIVDVRDIFKWWI